MRFTTSRSTYGASRYITQREIKFNTNRYNQQLARQRQLDDTGDWDDDLDPEDRARLMGRDFMGPRYR
jgi:hypothetical protein